MDYIIKPYIFAFLFLRVSALCSIGDQTLFAQFGQAPNFENALSLFRKERPQFSLSPDVLQALRQEYFYAAPRGNGIPFMNSPHISDTFKEKFFVINNQLIRRLFGHHPHRMIEEQMFGARHACSSLREVFSKEVGSPQLPHIGAIVNNNSSNNKGSEIVAGFTTSQLAVAGVLAVAVSASIYYFYRLSQSKKSKRLSL